MNTFTLTTLVLASLAVSARAQRLYSTSFETPDYVAGATIDGVAGWFSAISPNAPAIVDSAADATQGRRALRCWGGSPDLESTQGLLDGAWAHGPGRPIEFPQPPLVRVQCDVRLDGPDTGIGPADDLVSANLIARNGGGQSASMFVSSNGNVYCFANGVAGAFGYEFETPITLGSYARLAITYDYATHLAAFEVDGVTIGKLPFGGGANERFNGVFLEFAALDAPALVDPSLYTGYWDNIMIVATPGV